MLEENFSFLRVKNITRVKKKKIKTKHKVEKYQEDSDDDTAHKSVSFQKKQWRNFCPKALPNSKAVWWIGKETRGTGLVAGTRGNNQWCLLSVADELKINCLLKLLPFREAFETAQSRNEVLRKDMMEKLASLWARPGKDSHTKDCSWRKPRETCELSR